MVELDNPISHVCNSFSQDPKFTAGWRKVIVENGPPHAEKLGSKMIVEAGDWLTGHEANAGKHIKEAAGNTAQFA